jgi:hypothetical protein
MTPGLYKTVLISSLLTAGLWTSPASAEVRVTGTLSTGREFDGKLLRDDGRQLSLQEKKGTFTFYAANVVQCTVWLKGETIPRNSTGRMPMGRYAEFLLGKGHSFLAESMLLCGLTRTVKTGSDGEMTLMLWAMEPALARRPVTDSQGKAYKALYAKIRRKHPVRLGGAKPPVWRTRRYQLPSPRDIKSAGATRDDWARQMKQIAPETHKIETPHFFIYSAWSKSDDAKLKGVYEKLYAALCKQFDVTPTENIWIGKLPVYAFWEKGDFVKFSTKVAGISEETARKAGGFAGYRRRFQYVNLGPVMIRGMSKTRARTWFYEILVHESTHAFLARYISREGVPSWLNEGVAEMLAATFVPKGGSSRKMQAAHAIVKKGKAESFLPMMADRQIPIDRVSYGAAQSMVRFLVSKGKPKFTEYIYKIKSGVDGEKALQEVYGLTHEKLLQQWARRVR